MAKDKKGNAEDRLLALDLPEPEYLSSETKAYFKRCEEKFGFVPNVLKAYSFNEEKLQPFTAMYNDLMLGQSGLSKLEREMIAVTVSSINRCSYCLVAHGAALRALSDDPILADAIAMNYRTAALTSAQRAMLDFAVKMTEKPDCIEEADRAALRNAGFNDRDIWDIASVASFFNMSNRMATALDMQPNREYHALAR